MLFSGCSTTKLSPKKCYRSGDLRIKESDNGVKMFSFFVHDEFIQSDKSKQSKNYDQMTENEVSLLNEHLKRRDFCRNKENKSSFVITDVQNPVYQEVETRTGKVEVMNVTPMGFFGKCANSK